MKPLTCVILAGMLLAGATLGARSAEAGDRKHWRARHHDDRGRYDRDHYDRDRGRDGRYFSDREVYLVREYYRPRYRHMPHGVRKHYYRRGYLPVGWHRRIQPYPVYVERDIVVLPRGYRRGIIDGHAVVYNSRGLIIDVAVLF